MKNKAVGKAKEEYDAALKSRADEIRRLRDQEGLSFQEIGERMNPPISKQRTEQIYKGR